MVLTVEPRHMEEKRHRSYRVRRQHAVRHVRSRLSPQVIDARVERNADIEGRFENVGSLVTDPSDLTRLRFVIILQTESGDVKRLRFIQVRPFTAPPAQAAQHRPPRSSTIRTCRSTAQWTGPSLRSWLVVVKARTARTYGQRRSGVRSS
jgi:hypothetical protein